VKLSSIGRLLTGSLTAQEYSAAMSTELTAYSRSLGSGGHVPIHAIEDVDLVLDRKGLRVLCLLFASSDLSAFELAYTADILQMADRVEFSGHGIADDLSECTDPEINGPMTVERALEIAGKDES
jgi:hypothetical protein